MPRPRIVSIACATALWITAAAAAAQSGSWSNPMPFQYTEGQVAPRTEVRDPCIVRDGGLYYLVFTMWPFRNREEQRLDQPNQGGSPGIALYCSPDLKSWKFTTWLVKSSELPEDCPYKNPTFRRSRHAFPAGFGEPRDQAGRRPDTARGAAE